MSEFKLDPFETPKDFHAKPEYYTIEDKQKILDMFEKFWDNNKNLTFQECKKLFCKTI